jgi:hypothetical protein
MLIGSVVWAGEIGVVWGKSRISTRNRKNTEMTVPISLQSGKRFVKGVLCSKLVIEDTISSY